MEDQGSVVAGMGEATWSEEAGTAYEVALEGINHVVGLYSGLIAEAEKSGDTSRARELIEAQASWAVKRKGIGPEDRTAVEALKEECAREMLRLREGR